MMKSVLGAVIGARLMDKSPKVDGGTAAATGAVAGLVVPFVLSRVRISTMLAFAAGAYVMNEARNKGMLEKAKDALGQTKDDVVDTIEDVADDAKIAFEQTKEQAKEAVR